MDEKRPGNENPEAHGVEHKDLDLPLPGKDLLEHVIDVLQCGDKKDFSGQLVDPKEVPIDFGTIRTKVQDGIYNNLNEFESDILLILDNTMISTLPDTDYFKEVQAINNLAERVFNKLKTDPNRLKSEFPSKRSKRGREPGDEARSSSTKPGPNHMRRVGDPNDQPQLSTEEFCEKYDLLSHVRRNESRFSRFSTPSESTLLERTGCMPMPGILSSTRQESQHQSAPNGQQGDIYPVDRGAPQQQRQCDDAGPLVRLTHQEPHHTSDPHVRPSGSNPVDQGQQGGIYSVNQGAPQQQRQFNDAGPWGRLTHQEPYHTPDPGVRPSESDPVGWAEWKEYEQPLTTLGQTGYMPMPPQLGIPQHLLGAPTSQEPQQRVGDPIDQPRLSTQEFCEKYGLLSQVCTNPSKFWIFSTPSEGTLLEQLGCMPIMPGIPSPTHQESQHQSAPHGQQGGIYPVDRGAPQQQRQCNDAGTFVRLTHQEPRHTSDPRVRPSGSNPVDQGQQGGIYSVNQGAPQQQRQFNDAGPWGRLTHQEPYHAPDPGVRPSESDLVGWAEWKKYEQALTTLGQTGYMPMPPQLGIPQHLLGAPTSQEPQHLSAPHGQQGDIYAVDRGAPQQQRQCNDAGPFGQLTHQELYHASDPHVRPSGSNPVGQGAWQEHEQALMALGQTGSMPMPAQLGIQSELHGAPTLQESQHLFAPHGQQGGINPVDRGAPQQQRQHVFAGPLGWLTLHEPQHASNPSVRPSGSNPVGGGVGHDQALPPEYAHEQDFPQGRRHLNQRGPGQGPVGSGGSGAGAGNAYGGGAPQRGQQQQ